MAAALTINTFAIDIFGKFIHNLINAYSEHHMSRVLAKEAVLAVFQSQSIRCIRVPIRQLCQHLDVVRQLSGRLIMK